MFEKIGRKIDYFLWYIKESIKCLVVYHETYKTHYDKLSKEFEELLKESNKPR